MANLIFSLSCKAYHESWFLSWTSNSFTGRRSGTCVFFYSLLDRLKETFFICSFLYCIICSSLNLFHAKIFYWASTLSTWSLLSFPLLLLASYTHHSTNISAYCVPGIVGYSQVIPFLWSLWLSWVWYFLCESLLPGLCSEEWSICDLVKEPLDLFHLWIEAQPCLKL